MGLFYKDKPIFGFDIGRSTIKVMQIDRSGKKDRVVAYGTASFDSGAITEGVITDHEAIAEAAHKLLTSGIVGHLDTKRVAVSLPNEYSFSRVISLPSMDDDDLHEAVEAEVAQSIPIPNEDLYYDFEVARKLKDDSNEVQLIATRKAIVDSYIGLFDALGLEIALVESNILAMTRVVVHAEAHDTSTVIVDVGSNACDISVYDGKAIRATSTVDCSSEKITQSIADSLGVSLQQAHSIKTRYGLGVSKKQDLILEAAEKELKKLISEVRKVMRYFAERDIDGSTIGQIIILGGGANLPGLASYITDKTRVPTRLCAPWNNLDFGKLQRPHELETTLYTTAGGLGLVKAEDIA